MDSTSSFIYKDLGVWYGTSMNKKYVVPVHIRPFGFFFSVYFHWKQPKRIAKMTFPTFTGSNQGCEYRRLEWRHIQLWVRAHGVAACSNRDPQSSFTWGPL